jgi:hypothetical protein
LQLEIASIYHEFFFSITDPGRFFFHTNGKYQNLPINKMCTILQQAAGVIKKERNKKGRKEKNKTEIVDFSVKLQLCMCVCVGACMSYLRFR